jgi:Zn-dependent protease with chaperone function
MKIPLDSLKKAEHPNLNSRFNLALIVCIPVALVGLILTFTTFGLILIFIGLLIFFVWFGLNIAKAKLIANSVRVSNKNFQEIFEIYQDVKKTLDYDKEVPIYIIEEGTVNAVIIKFFKTKFIVLHSGLVVDMQGNNKLQMKWIIGRFIGALKAKHFKINFLRILIDSIEKIKIFNFFILSYERATQYTGDNIGLLVCENVEQVFCAFDKLLVGNNLSKQIQFEGLIDQARDVKDNFFALLARLVSSHPHLVDRYLNLIAFAQKSYPEQFEAFIEKYNKTQLIEVASLLPYYK